MIEICYEGVKLTKDENREVFNLWTEKMVVIQPQEIVKIRLPYKRLSLDKFLHFQLTKNFSLQEISCIYNNLNDNNSLTGLDLYLKNNKIKQEQWMNIDIDYNVIIPAKVVLGKVFC